MTNIQLKAKANESYNFRRTELPTVGHNPVWTCTFGKGEKTHFIQWAYNSVLKQVNNRLATFYYWLNLTSVYWSWYTPSPSQNICSWISQTHSVHQLRWGRAKSHMLLGGTLLKIPRRSFTVVSQQTFNSIGNKLPAIGCYRIPQHKWHRAKQQSSKPLPATGWRGKSITIKTYSQR